MNIEWTIADLFGVVPLGIIATVLTQIVPKPLLAALEKGRNPTWLPAWKGFIINVSTLVIAVALAVAGSLTLAQADYASTLQAVLVGIGATALAIGLYEGVTNVARGIRQ